METLLQLLGKSAEISEVLKIMRKKIKRQLLSGLSGSQKSCVLSALQSKLENSCLFLTYNAEEAKKIYEDLTTLLGEKVYLLPQLERDIMQEVPDEMAAAFCLVLDRILQGEQLVVVATAESLLLPLVPGLEKKKVIFRLGEKLDLSVFLRELVQVGYKREDITENPGQFSVRGGIVDFFPYNLTQPIRLEFFDDELDSIREYDPVSQRSQKQVSVLEINILGPQGIFLQEEEDSGKNFLDYLGKKGLLVVDEPLRCWEKEEKIRKIVYDSSQSCIFFSFLGGKLPEVQEINFKISPLGGFQQKLEFFVQQLKEWRRKNRVILLASTKERAKRLEELLKQEGIGVTSLPGEDLEVGEIVVVHANLHQGFHFISAQLVVVADQEIFGVKKKKSQRIFREKFDQGLRLTSLEDLSIGDYVVHINHGIGLYLGLETIHTEGIQKDYLALEYQNKDKLYIPIEQMDMLQKYLGVEGQNPKLSKLGGTEWSRLKKKVGGAVKELAKDLLELYAVRETSMGHTFAVDSVWQKEFEDAFPYVETEDQLRAIEEIKKDMESPQPMDRLLCGDVGYGKTEVAMRAAFKAVTEGKQVAVLVPTTILAQQHLLTFQERFKDYPISIEMLSRFRNPKEQQKIVKDVAKGKLDIIIGTHRLVQKDITFKDLGLVIVDEEQRFGVAHKEKLKQLRKNVDVLTLTATPIPRTLYMSLVKIRDMSVIETPPEDRFPIQTYIMEYDEEIIRDAIRQELTRKGQAFFVHNRVESIEKVAQQLSFLVPEARIAVGHGQMSEDELENTMWDFIQGKYDLLVCTTIIETGLDVPNVNTLIVDDADKVGLSSLYQLRGRVGRTNRVAYAYLTYRKNKVLTEIAEKRLQAMRDFTALGSGFKIAMRDLEIRGAGNILGGEQHGHISSIGFELYARMLQQAISELKGEANETITVQPTIELKVNAYIPDEYIPETKRKIEIYKKIAAADSLAEIDDVEDEIEDRFGDLPIQVRLLLDVARIKLLAKEAGVETVVQEKQQVALKFKAGVRISGNKLSFLINKYKGKIMVLAKKVLQANVKSQGVKEEELLTTIKDILVDIKIEEEQGRKEIEKE